MKYTTELGDKICRLISASGTSLLKICDQLNVPYSTVTGWAYDEQHEFHPKFVQAKIMQLYSIREEIKELSERLVNDPLKVLNEIPGIEYKKETQARIRIRIQARKALLKISPFIDLSQTKKKGISKTLNLPTPGEN